MAASGDNLATDQTSLLRETLRKLRDPRASHTPLCIFDLDGTLVDNRPRTLAILRHWAQSLNGSHSNVSSLIEKATVNDLHYLLDDSLQALGVSDEELRKQALNHWKAHFFFDPSIKHDVPLAGALNFARTVYEGGASIVYMTGRDLPNMLLGTAASLRDLGFPIGVPGTQLVLKPDAETPDDVFKRDVTPKLARYGLPLAAFDNEPGNCNVFKEMFPTADVYFVDTQHHPSSPKPAPGVHRIADFRM